MTQALTRYINKCFSLGEEWVTKKDNTVWGRHGKFLDYQRNLSGNSRIHFEKIINISALS